MQTDILWNNVLELSGPQNEYFHSNLIYYRICDHFILQFGGLWEAAISNSNYEDTCTFAPST